MKKTMILPLSALVLSLTGTAFADAQPTAPTDSGVAWFEISTTDLQKAETFYGGLFNWTFTKQTEDGFTFDLVTANGKLIGELNLVTQVAQGNGTALYFPVDDVPAAFAKGQSLGGATVFEPMAIPDPSFVGTIAELRDPDGNAVGLASSKPLP
jgi:predicted enzyme related to lactoylglutathione lyase